MASDVTWGQEQVRWTLKKSQLINGHFTTKSGHFFANHMVIFHKTEIQTVILRWLMSLDLNWYKSNDTKQKTQKVPICVFEQNHKNPEMDIFVFFCHNFLTN